VLSIAALIVIGRRERAPGRLTVSSAAAQ
jgi:hypothetical protein